MRPSPDSFILDASVAAKWYLPDEDFAEEARQVFAEFTNGRISLAAPSHIDFELANVLRTAVRRGRANDAWARSSLIAFLSLPISKLSGERLVLLGYDLANFYDCAAYDGLYIALAEEADVPLLHADERLRNTLSGRFAQELWIEDYQAPTDA